MRNRFAALAVFCTLGCLSVPAADAQTTAIYFDSQPGDYIGGGVRQTWTSNDLTFKQLSSTTSSSQVAIRGDSFASGGSTWWDLYFGSPDGTVLAPGVYEYASNFFFRSRLRPGLDIGGSGRACSSAGRFIVYEIAYDVSGALVRFAADFEQHCDGKTPALFGAIRFNSTRSSLTPFDGAYPVYALHADPSPFGRVTGGGLDCGDGGTTCDIQYGIPSNVTLTATPAPGYQFLAWSGYCAGALSQATVVVSTRKWCTPTFEAAPGSGMPPPFGGGTLLFVDRQTVSSSRGPDRWVMRSSDAVFDPSFSSAAHVLFRITAFDGLNWDVQFSAREGQTLVPGVYERATSATWHAPMTPGVEIGSDCSRLLGRFVIYDIAFDTSGRLARFAADAEQHCVGQTAGTFAAIRYNSTITAVNPFGGAYPVYSLTIDPPVNGTVSAPGITCGEGASDCAEAYAVPGTVAVTATPTPGHLFVGWTGDCTGSTTTQVLIATRQTCGAVFDNAPDATGPLGDDLRLGSLTFFSQRGDYIGLGLRQVWTSKDTQFLLRPAYSTTPTRWVDAWVKTPDGDSWSLDFSAPLGQVLRAGDYVGAMRFPFQDDARPGIDVSGHGRGCNTETGRFRVYEVEFDSANKVTKFAADFEQHCEGGASALFGAIRYNSTRASVLPFDGAFLAASDMSLDLPLEGSVVGRPFTISGFALNTGDSAGTGVDAVHVYAFPLPAGGPIFLGVATYGIVRADIGTRFGAQFRNSGFTLTSGSELATGRYLIAAIARDTVTGRFNTVRTATVTVSIPVSVPRMAIDSPIAGASVAGAFTIKGWAIDTGATAGPGVDVIHVYAMLVGGSTPIFLGVGTYGTPRPDIAGMFGAQFANSGYQLNAGGLSPGTYTIAVFARSTVSGQFSGAATTVTVASTTAMAIDLPAAGSRAPAPFAVAGWALDAAAPTGSGVDAIHAWALPLGGGAPIFLGVGLLDAPRPDVAAIYGARFANAGFNLLAPSLPPGAYTIAVFAHSAATGTFNQVKTVDVVIRGM